MKFSTTETIKHVFLILGALIVIAPFYFMVSYSFKSPREIAGSVQSGFFGNQEYMINERCVALKQPNRKDIEKAIKTAPKQTQTQIYQNLMTKVKDSCKMRPAYFNYYTAFTRAPLLLYLFNGIVVTASIFLLQVVVALPAAYALSKLKFWGREVVFSAVLLCLLIPVHSIALPIYIMLSRVGLTDSYAALIIPWTISAFGIFLMRQFFMTVPDDLIDAARMDGMSEFSIIWRVMLPTAIPALLAFAIFSVVAHWNDYFWPRMVITGNTNLFTPPLGMREFKSGLDGSMYGPIMATATVIVTPLVAVFLLAQRRFIEGITLSGMK